MKIFYNSRIAKIITFLPNFSTIMLFGAVFTESQYPLSENTKEHEFCHCRQYCDMFNLGIYLAIFIFLIFAAFEIFSLWLLLLVCIPLFLYYICYGAEYVYYLITERKGSDHAYESVSFERHAYWIEQTCYKPEGQRRFYVSFDWWRKSYKGEVQK